MIDILIYEDQMYVPINILSSSQLAWWNHWLSSGIYLTGMPSHPGRRNKLYARNCKTRFSTTRLLWQSRDNSYPNHMTTVTQCNWLGPLNDVYDVRDNVRNITGVISAARTTCVCRSCNLNMNYTTHAENCTWQLRIPDLERWLQDDWEDVRLIFITKSSQIL